jgi:carbon storage regulator
MLVLTRKINESFRIGDNIDVTVIDIRGGTARMGIEAPRDIPVTRHKLLPTVPTVPTVTGISQ